MIKKIQGTDITEAYEVHHINTEQTAQLLSKYYIRDAVQPRNFKFTFNENGFYKTFKKRVAKKLATIDRTPELLTKVSLIH